MELLINRKGARSLWSRARWALLLASVTVAGCAVFGAFSSGSQGLAFPHARHLQEDLGLECDACHADWESSDQPGMPVIGVCKLCHEEIDSNKPADRRIDVLFDGDSFKARHVSKLTEEVIFSHQRHANGGLKCEECHVGINTNSRIDRTLGVGMSACTTCHEQKQKPTNCSTCHKESRADVPPRTHEVLWMKLHGQKVRAHDEQQVNQCSMCHTESTCVSCHNDTPPENHDNYFRRRAHGLFARMDRENCSACHRSDSCDECHKSTKPMTHAGSFGGGSSSMQTHCVSCHFPVSTTDCYTCHKSTPSHNDATPLPGNHNPGMNCRMCHIAPGSVQPALNHIDKGDTCTTCHR